MVEKLTRLDQYAVIMQNMIHAAHIEHDIYSGLNSDAFVVEFLKRNVDADYAKYSEMTLVERYTFVCEAIRSNCYINLLELEADEFAGSISEIGELFEAHEININAFIDCFEEFIKSRKTVSLPGELSPDAIAEIVNSHDKAKSFVVKDERYYLFNGVELCEPDTYVPPDIEPILKRHGLI